MTILGLILQRMHMGHAQSRLQTAAASFPHRLPLTLSMLRFSERSTCVNPKTSEFRVELD